MATTRRGPNGHCVLVLVMEDGKIARGNATILRHPTEEMTAAKLDLLWNTANATHKIVRTQFLQFTVDILCGATGASALSHAMVALRLALVHVQIPHQHTGEEDVFSRDWDELETSADATLIVEAQGTYFH